MKTNNTARSSILRASIGFTLALFYTTTINADTDQQNPDYWYSVELLIFKQNEKNEGKEQWPNEIELRYPPELAFLISKEEHQRSNIDQDSQYILNGADSPAPSSGARNNTANNLPSNLPSNLPGNSFGNTLDSTYAHETDIKEAKGQTLPDPFVLLSPDQLELQDAANQLAKKGGKTILFHQRWFQYLIPNRDFSYLLVTGGQQYDEHFELEGSIGLKRSRYLHIDTNLWLSHFIPNPAIWNDNLISIAGDSTEFESSLVDNELSTPLISSVYTKQSPLYSGLDNPYLAPTPDWPILPTLPSRKNGTVTPAADLDDDEVQALQKQDPVEIQAQTSSTLTEPETNTQNTSLDTETINSSELLSQYYTHDEIVRMKQRRRMRSGETHYIDHPKFGLIIRIQRFDSIN
jgi:hypothetical protein